LSIMTPTVGWATPDQGSGTPYLVPLSFLWDGTTLLVATPASSPTGRNLQANGKVRLGNGMTRSVTLTVTAEHPARGSGGVRHAALRQPGSSQKDRDDRTGRRVPRSRQPAAARLPAVLADRARGRGWLRHLRALGRGAGPAGAVAEEIVPAVREQVAHERTGKE
jgi:Pyridoxamine 5'-phosphate oxidase